MPKQILVVVALLAVMLSGCGTLDVRLAEPETTRQPEDQTDPPAGPPAVVAAAPGEILAWYGTIHSVPGSPAGSDYLKPWHLAIWPKFGQAVGLTGADPAVNAEIDRLRDQDIKATFWGSLTCNVADYGACQLLVDRISADDGGAQYAADRVAGWVGQIGRLPVQPGSQNALLYFVLDDPVISLYGIASDDPAVHAELDRLADDVPESGGEITIWGEVRYKAQPVTGTVIAVERLEIRGQ